ncbi:MAG: iron ABC transporter substrate-binding protein [Anaerolineales bacterium]|nr:ABC transporter substrate-binding protein [Anaerolineae bacterium]PWB69032.1 MAG: iron ABC transporter substrate-binding protein [Anaerolineales bacterium]
MSSSTQHPSKKASRRDFLKVGATVLGTSAVLAACGPQATEVANLPDLTSGNSIPLEDLIAAAKTEGQLTTIALPHDWANYGEIIETFKTKYGLTINELNPDAGSADELEAIRANKESKGPQAPDVIDIGIGHTATALADGLVAKYKVSTWDSIPDDAKNPDGYWWGEYYGVLAFEVVKPDVENTPQDWEDLLKPEYKGKVAMAGDVLKSNQAVQTVMAAGLSRTGGDIEKAPEAGLQFWKEMVDSGNFIPVIADQGRIAQRETLIVMEWDYLALANRDALGGNPELDIVVPKSGVLAGPYAGGISAYAPHPYAARLWWEFVMSDEGQNLYLKGYAHPIRYNDMAARGVIPADLAAKLPPAENYERATFLSVEQLQASNKYITENWRKVVYGE